MRGQRFLRYLRPVLALLVVQGSLVLVYVWVERGRTHSDESAAVLGDDAPELRLEHEDRSVVRLADLKSRRVLVHFWATWCPPCRSELPTLLAMADAPGIRESLVVLAVSVDDDWPSVRAFFKGQIPNVVVRAEDHGAHASFGGTKLPDTFLVSPEGKLERRLEGARDWSRAEVRRELVEVAESTRRSR